MIMLWGIPGDSTLMLVYEALTAMGKAPFFLNQQRVLEMEVTLSVGGQVGGEIRVAGQQQLDLAQVSSLYLRPYETLRIPSLAESGSAGHGAARAMQTEDALYSWADLMPGLVVNRPSAMAINSSKPFQSARLQEFFEVPRTLITTDPDQVRQFRRDCGAVIYKSVSSVRSIVTQLMPDEDSRLEDIVWCPTQFQELIRGVDYRVHVVGSDAFACRIRSNAADYRYAGRSGLTVDVDPYELPDQIAQSCVEASHAMGLAVSGADLRQREDGRWYCFEVNPSPAFSYFQEASRVDIASAVARLLSVGP